MDIERLEFASGSKEFIFFFACGPAMWVVYLLKALGDAFMWLIDRVSRRVSRTPSLFKKVK